MDGQTDKIMAALRRKRKDLKINQIVAAKQAGISQTYLSQLESGHKSPSLRTLRSIADGLGVDLEIVIIENWIAKQDFSRSRFNAAIENNEALTFEKDWAIYMKIKVAMDEVFWDVGTELNQIQR